MLEAHSSSGPPIVVPSHFLTYPLYLSPIFSKALPIFLLSLGVAVVLRTKPFRNLAWHRVLQVARESISSNHCSALPGKKPGQCHFICMALTPRPFVSWCLCICEWLIVSSLTESS